MERGTAIPTTIESQSFTLHNSVKPTGLLVEFFPDSGPVQVSSSVTFFSVPVSFTMATKATLRLTRKQYTLTKPRKAIKAKKCLVPKHSPVKRYAAYYTM